MHLGRVQWRRDLHHSNRRFALCTVIFDLLAAAQPWKSISVSSRRTVIVLMLLPEVVWNWGQTIFTCYVLQHSAVPFYELVWPTTSRLSRCCSWTFPLHNNSTSSWPGQLKQGRNLINWLVGKVAFYDGATLKVTELFSKAILPPCLSMEIAWLFAQFYTPVWLN
jgi:hypothetical protein